MQAGCGASNPRTHAELPTALERPQCSSTCVKHTLIDSLSGQTRSHYALSLADAGK